MPFKKDFVNTTVFFLKIMVIATLISQPLLSIDNPHFYRATYFWGEPRFEKPWLTSIDVSVGGAYTGTARNKHGTKTSLLNIFGPQAAQHIGANVPNLDPANPFDKILIDLEALPENGMFGTLQFAGKFHTIETILSWYQNLANGFFLQTYLPLRTLRINHIHFSDLSPDNGSPNKNTATWQAFLTNFNKIMERHHISLSGAHRAGFGDLTFLGGWAINYEDTCIFDFVDIDAKVGILLPTGHKKDEHEPFDMALGYNGYYAFPLLFDISVGALDWLTVGLHLDTLFFFDQTRTIALKTARSQNGFIKLAFGKAFIDPGNIWDINAYAKADHIIRGFSLLIGYTFSRQDDFCINPIDTTTFDPIIATNDTVYKAWNMHVIHFWGEYDFTRTPTDWGPRIGLFFNKIIRGRQIFNANSSALGIGCDLVWRF